jgi:3-hydroxyisobutyrate dehydrogenase-like beta-hydroxyacid dehydrogenase
MKNGDSQMTQTRVGFIGFGEVASVFSRAMQDHGARVSAYDVLLEREGGFDTLRKRARGEGIEFAPLAGVVLGSHYLFSTVTTQKALDAARAAADHLAQGQVYVDLNSTAPPVKLRIAEAIGPTGADFVEGAILGAVGASGAATRILTGGEKGATAADALCRLGLNASFFSPEIGKASTFKMLRSVFSKGVEALLLEMLAAGAQAGMEKELWRDVTDYMSRHPFEAVASNWVSSHATAHERRFFEMAQVAATMRSLGFDPLMTIATEAFFERSRWLGFDRAFEGRPESVEKVAAFMAGRLAGTAR